ncbi:MAG: DUF5703 domain-containing protein [Cyclobacteriaceae bacterium]
MKRRNFIKKSAITAGLTASLPSYIIPLFDNKTDDKSYIDDYNVVWDTQSKNSAGSMPLVGGNMGCNVWVENNNLLFYFSSPGARDENGALLKFGRVRVNFTPNIFQDSRFSQKLNMKDGAIYIETNSSQYGRTKIKLWAEINRPVIHSEIESEQPLKISATYESWRYTPILLPFTWKNRERGMVFCNYSGWPDDVYVYPDHFNPSKNEMLFYHRMKEEKNVFNLQVEQQELTEIKDQLFDPMTNLTFGGIMKGENLNYVSETTGEYAQTPFKGWKYETSEPVKKMKFKIFTHIKQTETIEAWNNELQTMINEDISDKKAWNDNILWWNNFWQRSIIVINSEKGAGDHGWEIGKNYNLFRYMLVSGFFANEPTLFNGGVLTFDPGYESDDDRFGQGFTPDQRRWGAALTAQNMRLVVWPMLKNGDFDGILPAFDFYKNTLKTTGGKVKHYWGHDGCCCEEQTSITGLLGLSQFGYNDERVIPLRFRPADYETGVSGHPGIGKLYESQLEYAWMMLEYYDFTGNDISEYIPFIEQAVIFYDEHYRMRNKQRTGSELDEKGKLVIYPSNTLEGHTNCKNPTSVIAGLTAVLNGLQALPDSLQSKAKKARWRSILSVLPEYPVNKKNGNKYLKPADDYEHSHSHTPEMYPLYPYQLHGLGMDNLELMRNTFLKGNISEQERMNDKEGWYQGVIHFARLGMADEAQKTLHHKLGDGPFRFPGFSVGKPDHSPDHNRSGTGMIGLQEMLLQTHDGKLHMFPAWPKDWDVEFKLHAPKKTIISGNLINGELMDLKITPERRNEDLILYL